MKSLSIRLSRNWLIQCRPSLSPTPIVDLGWEWIGNHTANAVRSSEHSPDKHLGICIPQSRAAEENVRTRVIAVLLFVTLVGFSFAAAQTGKIETIGPVTDSGVA